MTDLQVRKSSQEQLTQEPRTSLWKAVLGGVAIFVIVAATVAAVTVRSTEPAGRSQAAIEAETARLNGLAEFIAGQEPTGLAQINDHVAQVQAIQAAQRQAQAELTAERNIADAALEPSAPAALYADRVLENLANWQPAVPSVSETADKVMQGYVTKQHTPSVYYHERVLEDLANWQPPVPSVSETADKVLMGYIETPSAATFDELEGADRVFQNFDRNSSAEPTSRLGPAWDAYGDRYNAMAENLVEGDGPD